MAFHSFNSQFAAKHGVNEAILMNYIYYWCNNNRLNKINIFEGKAWIFQSLSAFEDVFPYFTASKIRTAMSYLLSKGFIVKGNFNKSKYDRTAWYAISDKGYQEYKDCCVAEDPNKVLNGCENIESSICQESQMENVENHRPIQLSNKLIKNLVNDLVNETPSESVAKECIKEPEESLKKEQLKDKKTQSKKSDTSELKKIIAHYSELARSLFNMGMISEKSGNTNFGFATKRLKELISQGYTTQEIVSVIDSKFKDEWCVTTINFNLEKILSEGFFKKALAKLNEEKTQERKKQEREAEFHSDTIVKISTIKTCPDCGEPLNSMGYCWICEKTFN